MNTLDKLDTMDKLDTEITRSAELEEQLFTLLGETGEAWRLISELTLLNFQIGHACGQVLGKGV